MNWYIKELSTLTKVSVRTLHHYDALGLLKPSVRLINGYRLYSEKDLLRLQQIVALKFFGFSLQQIKQLLDQQFAIVEHFEKQRALLDEQAGHLAQVGTMLDELMLQAKQGKSLEWSRIIQLIGVYQMTKELSKTWVGQAFSPDQLKQFAEIQQRFTEKQLDDHGKRWVQLMEKIKTHLHKHPEEGPTSAIGQKFAQEWQDLLDEVYADYPELQEAMSLAYKYNRIPHCPYDQKLYDFLGEAFKYMMAKKKK